jgi:autotransporter-associated beta strand protein
MLILSGQADSVTRNTVTNGIAAPNHTVQAGTLRLDYSSNNFGKLSDNGQLILGGTRFGGTLQIRGGSHVEIVAGTTVATGRNFIQRLTDISSTSILRMNSIGRQTGATLDFSADDIVSTDTDNVNGILGGWATVGGASWATKSTFTEGLVDSGVTTGQDKLIRGLATYTNAGALPGPVANEWAVNANMNVIGNSSQDTRTTNTLRFHNSTNVAGNSPFRVSLTGANVLQSSAILFTSNMAAHSGVIEGSGSLSGGAGLSSDLIILQNNTSSGSLEISAVISNLAPSGRNGTLNSNNQVTAVSLVGLVPGLTVNGANIPGGTTISAITVTDAVNQIGTLTLSANASNSGSTPLSFTPVANGLDKSGSGSLILSGLNTYTGVNTLNAGNTTIRNLSVQGYTAGTQLISFAPSLGRTLSNVSDTTGLTIGMNVTGTAITGGVTVTSINAVNNTVGLSNGAVTSLGGTSITFGSNVTAKSGVQAATVNNNSATVTVPGGTAGITIGQSVSGVGIPVGAVVIAINNTTQITIGQIIAGNAVADPATAPGTSITLGSNSTAGGVRTADTDSGSLIVVGSTLGMTVGQTVSGNGIPGGATISRILDSNNVELSVPVTVTGQNNLTYGASSAIGSSLLATTSGGSPNVTVTSTANLSVGERVSGPGIPEGTTVAAILSSTQVVLSASAVFGGSSTLVFAGTASGLGASSNAVGNLIFNGGILQFNGTTASTDRGFTINDTAILDVGNAYSNLRLGGNYATPANEESYAFVKRGEGTLDMLGTAFGGYGLEALMVEDGVLRLSPAFNDQYIRNDVGALILSGGTLEVRSVTGRSTTQNMIGTMQVREGASIIRTIGATGSTTFLNLQDLNNPTAVDYQRGGTVLFDVRGGPTVSQIVLAGRALLDVGVILPRTTFTNRSVQRPGVNDFGFVDSATTILSGSDIKGAHNFISDPAGWTATRNVHDGALPEESFRGTTVSGASVNTILFFNNDIALAGDRVSADPVISRVPGVDRLTVGMTVRGNGIQPGSYIISIDQANSTITLNKAPSLSDNTGLPLYFFNASVTGDLATGSATITNINDPRFKVGQGVFGPGIPDGTTILAINTANNTITLSQAVTSPGVGSRIYSEYLATNPTTLNSSTVNISDLLTLVSGAILQTTNSGNHVNTLSGGLLTSGLANSDGTSADLIIHNWNPKEPLLISSSIVNNTALNRILNLVQTGDGTTILSTANSYTGTTFVQGGVLRLDHVAALSANSRLRLDGGVIGLNSGNFTRALGSGAGQVDWTSSGGFAAYNSQRTVNLGGVGASVAWGTAGFVPDNTSLILGAQDATGTVIFANGIDLGRKSRMIEAVSGRSDTFADARITGVLDGDAGRIIKGGNGVLELAAANTYTGGTSLAQGTLVGIVNSSFGTGRVEVGTTTDTRSSGMALMLHFQGNTLANPLAFGSVNADGISVLNTTASTVSITGGLEIARLADQNLLVGTSPSNTISFDSPITGTGGLTIVGGRAEFSAANNFGSLAGQVAGAAVNGAIVIRNGSVFVNHTSAMVGVAVIELGDSTPAVISVDYATAGASLLGVERDTQFIAKNISGLGGAFEAQGGGLVSGGFPNAGPGAFYNVSRVIDGVTFGSADVGKKILVKDEVDNPERNGVYQIIQINQDLTMNLVRVTEFSTAANMLYGTQVTVNNGTHASQTFFMAAPSVTTINSSGTDPVHWLSDNVDANVTLRIHNSAVTAVTQAIDVNANGVGQTTIVSDSPVNFSGALTLQNLRSTARETKTLRMDSGTSSGTGLLFSGRISEAAGGTGATDDILSLQKLGTGVVTLGRSDGNTYNGDTTVSDGTLQVTNSSGSGTGLGNVLVNAQATLAGSGFIAPGVSKNVTIADFATIAPGTVGASSGQALSIQLNGGDFSLQGILDLNLFTNSSGITSTEADRLVLGGTGTVTLGTFATLKVTSSLNQASLVAGSAWKILDWGTITRTGKFSGLDEVTNPYLNDINLPSLDAGLYWDITNLYTTGNLVVAVPEPSRLLLWILALLSMASRRRRPLL